MGILKALSHAVSGTLADQWKEIVAPSNFDEHTVVVPGVFSNKNNGRGINTNGSSCVISNGSKIFVPQNTVAFIFSGAGIENVIDESGVFEYQDGEESIFNGDGAKRSIVNQVGERFAYGGISPQYKQIAYVNLREIRNIKFGTRGPQTYHDQYYDCDLEVLSYGMFSVKVVDAQKFINNFVPANTFYYSFDDANARNQIVAEFTQSFIVALNNLSATYRISQITSQANNVAQAVLQDEQNAGSWVDRFGLQLVHVSIENIDFSDESKKLVRKYSQKRIKTKAHAGISPEDSNNEIKHTLVDGAQQSGIGRVFGAIFGHKLVDKNKPPKKLTLNQQNKALRQLKKLLDDGIITQEEFDTKKKEILGLN